jgi:hypothetical protein
MLAARTQAKPEARPVQNHRGDQENREPDVRRYVRVPEKERPHERNASEHRHVLNPELVDEWDLLYRPNVPGDVNRDRRREHVYRGSAYDLVRLHVDGRVAVQKRDGDSGRDRHQHRKKQNRLARQRLLNDVDEKYPGKPSQNHRSLKGDVDDAAALGKHPAEGHD